MTNLEALIAACNAHPEEDTPRLAYLDALEELHGTTDFITATREFYAKCREPRRYEHWMDEDGSVMGRRALSGWREWLATPVDTTYRVDGKPPSADAFPAFAIFHADRVADVMNWHRLVPSLWSILGGDDKWRRVGSSVTVQRRIGPGSYHEGAVRLEFANGWLELAEFRGENRAEDLMPAVLQDQPFAMFGIFGAVGKLREGDSAFIREGRCYRVFRDLTGHIGSLDVNHEHHLIYKNPKEAGAALSRALKQRARSLTLSSASPS